MRRWLFLMLLAGCGDDRLPDFATGQPPFGYDATVPALDASLDAHAPDAGDAALTDPDRTDPR